MSGCCLRLRAGFARHVRENEVVNSHLDSSLERLRVFYEYQTTSGVAGVGCSQKHHSGSEQYIEKAEKLLREMRVI
jgi:hypothetical protein